MERKKRRCIFANFCSSFRMHRKTSFHLHDLWQIFEVIYFRVFNTVQRSHKYINIRLYLCDSFLLSFRVSRDFGMVSPTETKKNRIIFIWYLQSTGLFYSLLLSVTVHFALHQLTKFALPFEKERSRQNGRMFICWMLGQSATIEFRGI